MKPNLIVIQPPHVRMDSVIEEFCESFCDSHYVYLVRPDSAFREDSSAGVRFLSHSLDRLPAFGEMDSAIAIADPAIVDHLKRRYPGSKMALWDPGKDPESADLIVSLNKLTVVHGEFGGSTHPELARAV